MLVLASAAAGGGAACTPGSSCCVRHPRVPSCSPTKSRTTKLTRPSPKEATPQGGKRTTCGWASGCCRRKPTECRDASHLRIAPAPSHTHCLAGGGGGAPCCAGTPVHMRIGKTGSKSTISQLSKTEVSGCAQTAVFHDVLAAQLPPTQAKLTVMREPCDRASSVLRHLHEFAPPSDRVHAVRTLTGLAEYLQARWSNVTLTPWPETDPQLHHFIVAWPQSWYIDACTHVLCYATPLRAPVHAYCAARRDGKHAPRRAAPELAASAAAANAAASADAEGCAAIRRLYREDWALYQAHCLRPAQ